MMRFRIKELIAQKEFAEQRRVTLGEISQITGIHRMTLSKIVNKHSYSTTTHHLDLLCEFFGCRVDQLMEHTPSNEIQKRTLEAG